MAEIILHPILRHRGTEPSDGFCAELAHKLSESVANLEAALLHLRRSPVRGDRRYWHADLVSRLGLLIDAGRALQASGTPELEEIERHLQALTRLSTDHLQFVEACRNDRV